MVYIEEKWNVQETCRIDNFLREKLPALLKKECSNSKIRRFIIAGCVFVNGKQCRIPSFSLRKGSLVYVKIEEEKLFFEKKPDDITFELTEKDVLFEDEYIIIVNKPAFLPTEGTIVQDRKNLHQCVVDYLWRKNPSLRNPPYAGIMHRLDRETSGTILFTKTRAVNKAVFDMFEKHTAKKTYRAVSSYARNNPLVKKQSFFVDNYIGRVSAKSQACKIGVLPESKGGLYAHTDFEVVSLDEDKCFCYLDCRLLTGRTHQIRVHLSSLGLAIIGDELYGGKDGFAENNGRIMLHSYMLEFPHPVTNEVMKVVAPLPSLFYK